MIHPTHFTALRVAVLVSMLSPTGFAMAQDLEAQPADAGLLDTPVTPAVPLSPGSDTVAPAVNQQALTNQVEAQQDDLEELPSAAIAAEAEEGDRVAQAALGSSLAKESQALANIPALANDAAGDALKWYNFSAGRGVPGSPATDAIGVKTFPVRVVRARQGS